MQLYALDQNCPVLASEAKKSHDYLCAECFNAVRLKSGSYRQAHFFHLKSNPHCRQHQKGIIHLKLQYYIQSLFPLKQLSLEQPFPSIGRIADVADLENKLIFEIQCSFISLSEAKKRCEDYESLGFTIIWILHDQRYNKKYFNSSENFLRSKICYFTNADLNGQGVIYDQFEILKGTKRIYTGAPLKVDLRNIKKLSPEMNHFEKLPIMLKQRLTMWTHFHQGDLIDRFFNGSICSSFYLEAEKRMIQGNVKKKFSLFQLLKKIYLTFFQLLLEKASK